MLLALGLGGCSHLEEKAPKKKYPTMRKNGKTYQVIPAADMLMRKEVTPPPAPNTGNPAIIISLNDQRAWLYKDGLLAHTSATCTGKPGHKTPTGTFHVIAKHRDWISTIYGVPMPHFLRLNAVNGMVGLHAGAIALTPASHGCIRLPADMAKTFFETTPVGTKVTIVEGVAPSQTGDRNTSDG
jgi:lipoprotein-anchoring transpeptidase ErfK/SrfK